MGPCQEVGSYETFRKHGVLVPNKGRCLSSRYGWRFASATYTSCHSLSPQTRPQTHSEDPLVDLQRGPNTPLNQKTRRLQGCRETADGHAHIVAGDAGLAVRSTVSDPM